MISRKPNYPLRYISDLGNGAGPKIQVGGREVLIPQARDKVGKKIELAIKERRLDRLSLKILTEESLRLYRSSWKGTGFHLAAIHRQLHLIPKQFFTLSNLLARDSAKSTVFHLAAERRQLFCLPAEFLNVDNLSIPDYMGVTPLHWAISSGCLDQVPTSVINNKTILLRNCYGTTVLHWASIKPRGITQVPGRFLSRGMLLERDYEGRTVFHQWAEDGGLAGLDLTFITTEMLFKSDDEGHDSFFYAARGRQLRNILIGPIILNEFQQVSRQVQAAVNDAMTSESAREEARLWLGRLGSHILRQAPQKRAISRSV